MPHTSLFSHAELEQSLSAATAEGSASEAHGLLAGIICAGGKSAPQQWLEHMLGENTLSAAAAEVRRLLATLHADILRQFNDDAFGFDLLLPGDDAPLSLRTEALSQWCGGFLYGLALGGFRDDTEMPDNVNEVMKDFYEISHARFAYEATHLFGQIANQLAAAALVIPDAVAVVVQAIADFRCSRIDGRFRIVTIRPP